MGRKSSFPKKLLIAIPIGIIVILFLNLESSEFPVEVPFTVYADNNGFNCKIWASISETDTNGKKTSYSPQTVFFKPQIPFDLYSSQTAALLRNVDTDAYVQCSAVSSSLSGITMNLVGGKVTTYFFVRDDSGENILVKTLTQSVPTSGQDIRNPNKALIPSGKIDTTELNSKISSQKSFFTTRITAYMDFELNFKSSATGSKIQTTHQSISAIIPAKFQNTEFKPSTPINNVVKLTSVSPAVIDLKDYTGKTVTITVRGQLEQWKDSEGIPYVDIYEAGNTKFQLKVPMNVKRIISTSTNTYEFSLLSFDIPKTAKLGTWQVVMHSNNDVRKTSSGQPSTDIKTFIIKNSAVGITPPSTTPPTEEKPTPEKSSCGGAGQPSCCNIKVFANGTVGQCLPVKGFIAYNINLEGGAVSGTVPNVQLFDVSVVPKATLTGELKGSDKRVVEIQLRPQLDLSQVSDKIYVNNGQFKHTYNILVNGESKITDKSFSGRQLDSRTVLTSSKFYQLGFINLNPLEITKELSNVELQNGDVITFLYKVSGSADITKGTEKYSMVVDGMQYQYDMINVADYKVDGDEPCKGKVGEEYIKCADENNLPPADSGGYCEGLTSAECAALNGKSETDPYGGLTDFFNKYFENSNEQTSGNPKGTSGTSGLCSGMTATECLDLIRESQKANPLGFVFTDSVLIVGGIIFVMIIIIIIVVASRKRQ